MFTIVILIVDCYHADYDYDPDAGVCYDYDSGQKEYTESLALCAIDTAVLAVIHNAATDTAVKDSM